MRPTTVEPMPPLPAIRSIDPDPASRPQADTAPAETPTLETTRAGILLGVSLVLIAFNLRPVFSSLAALLPEVMRDTGASAAVASLITTLPVLCLGLFSPLAPPLARRFGSERVILACLIGLGLGTALRGGATIPALLVAAVLAGAAIAIINVLLPSLIKANFPDRMAAMMGLYATSLSGGAAAAAGLTVPLERGFDHSWRIALAAWAVPALVVALVWAPQAYAAAPRPAARAKRRSAIWRSPLAWQVSLFMGLQSALAYCVFGWLAPILRERGLDAAEAGFVVTVSVFGQMAACLVAPSLAVMGRDQRIICVGLFVVIIAAFLGCQAAPLWTVWGWSALLGLGQGGAVAVALTLILLRAPDASVAAQLSGMAQGLGYTLAAAGPLLVGLLRQWLGDFSALPWLVIGIGGAGILAGLGAGRDRLVVLGPRPNITV